MISWCYWHNFGIHYLMFTITSIKMILGKYFILSKYVLCEYLFNFIIVHYIFVKYYAY